MLTLSWAPSGAGPDGASPSSRSNTAGATLAKTWRAPIVRPPAVTTSARSPSVRTDTTSASVTSSTPRLSAAAASWPDTVPMPPTGMSQWPVPRADDVVEEAPVGEQVVGVGERADQRVGEDDAAGGVVLDVLLDRLTDRALDEHPPRLVADVVAEVAGAAQRLRQRREHPLGQGCARQAERTEARRGGRHVASPQLDVEAELVDDLRREQADEVRVLRQQGIVGREHPRADRVAPPSTALRSSTTTDRPASARYAAHASPLCPPPITTASYRSMGCSLR